jgi:hypothetical protein
MLQSLASAAVRSSVEARRGRALASADSAQTRSRSAPKRTQTIGLVMNGVYFKAANTSARLARIFMEQGRVLSVTGYFPSPRSHIDFD